MVPSPWTGGVLMTSPAPLLTGVVAKIGPASRRPAVVVSTRLGAV